MSQDWPRRTTGKGKEFPESSLLAGYEDAIWRALAQVDPKEFDRKKGMQMPIREALGKIGLGWVASNSVPVRMVCYEFYKEVNGFYRHNYGQDSDNWKRPSKVPKTKMTDVEETLWDTKDALSFVLVDQDCTADECIFPTDVTERINTAIQETGMCLIREAVEKATIQRLRLGESDSKCHPHAIKIKEAGRIQRITELTGAGTGGEQSLTCQSKKGKLSSYYVDVSCKYLDLIQDVIVSSLKGEQNIIKSAKHRKSILLKYSKGAENFSHTDGNNGHWFEYQALLMLSDSDEYDGGEFYVAKRDGEKIIRTCCPLNGGDLVIFQAGSGVNFQGQKYFHGMKQVTRGERVGVGLLQVRANNLHPEEKNPGKGTKKRKNVSVSCK